MTCYYILRLPAELRNRIYKLVFPGGFICAQNSGTTTKGKWHRSQPIQTSHPHLYVNKLFNKEYGSLLYSRVRFQIVVLRTIPPGERGCARRGHAEFPHSWNFSPLLQKHLHDCTLIIRYGMRENDTSLPLFIDRVKRFLLGLPNLQKLDLRVLSGVAGPSLVAPPILHQQLNAKAFVQELKNMPRLLSLSLGGPPERIGEREPTVYKRSDVKG